MRKKKVLIVLIAFMLSFASPNFGVQASNETEANTVLLTETETQILTEIEPIIDETELRKELANSYVRLETKYQKEKNMSRTIISALIFVIVILFGVLVNVVCYYRKKLRNMKSSVVGKRPSAFLQEEIPKKKAEKILQGEQPKKKVEKSSKEEVSKKKIQKTEVKNISHTMLKEEIPKEKLSKEKVRKETELKEKAQKQKTKKVKSEIGRNGLEVFDFNDED